MANDLHIADTEMSSLTIVRGRINRDSVREILSSLYSDAEIERMRAQGVDQRMIFGINPHYMALALGGGLNSSDGTPLVPDMPPSKAILALVMPRLDEAIDLSGQADPSNQMHYSPETLRGKILHKYDEIVLGYAALACSAHCRYCYRLDLFNKSTGKSLVKPHELRDYVRDYNQRWAENGGIDPTTGARRYPIREVLLSGGDPMTLRNQQLYTYLEAIAEAGVSIIRIGTKELAFRPERFDRNFIAMLSTFHDRYPEAHVNFVMHMTHPDEFLLRDSAGNYVHTENGFRWLDVSRQAVLSLARLPFVSMENQTPMISRVNDDADTLRLLHQELRRMNIRPKYIFQNREIEGHRAFAVPVETAWRIHTDAMRGVSDTGRSRFALSTAYGKMELVSVIDGMDDATLSDAPAETGEAMRALFGDGLVIFKLHRAPFDAEAQGDLIIARRNPAALWLTGYKDRILYDGRKRGADKYAGMAELILDDLWTDA